MIGAAFQKIQNFISALPMVLIKSKKKTGSSFVKNIIYGKSRDPCVMISNIEY